MKPKEKLNYYNLSISTKSELNNRTDLEIISQLIETDDYSLFMVLIDRYRNMIFRLALGYFPTKEDAEDVVQEIFIKIFINIKNFKGECAFSTWIYRIGINFCLNSKRKKQIKTNFLWEEIGISADSSPEKELMDKDIFMNINNAISSLPANQKTAFVLSKFNELSQRQIAEIMQLTESSIESLIFRAKNNLKKILKNII